MLIDTNICYHCLIVGRHLMYQSDEWLVAGNILSDCFANMNRFQHDIVFVVIHCPCVIHIPKLPGAYCIFCTSTISKNVKKNSRYSQ